MNSLILISPSRAWGLQPIIFGNVQRPNGEYKTLRFIENCYYS
ncbi:MULTISPECIES: hypothetical protein [unclassified Microcoleus]|nr:MULTISPECIES: hypothetical protein [unclassified Microcoleus]